MSNVIDLRPETLEREINELNERIVKLGNDMEKRDAFEKELIRNLHEINENTYWSGKLLSCICRHFEVFVPEE